MDVKLKMFHKDAVIPQKAYDKDFCYDLVAVSEEEIAPNVWKYGFGFGLQIERGDELIHLGYEGPFPVTHFINTKEIPLNLSIDIRPRSSVWKTGMVLSNCTGTVDEGYINEISAVFYHVMPNMPRYKVGDRIAQMKIGMTFPVTFEKVEKLNETERGLNGYGSSGK